MPATAEFWRDPAMPHVESRRACASRACYRPHSHPSFSIGAVDVGSSRFTGAAGGTALLGAGTVVFVPAHRVHACNPLPHRAWSYQMLHVDAGWLAALRRESGVYWPQRVTVTRDRDCYAQFCGLNALLFSDAPVLAKEAALIEFLVDRGGVDAVPVEPGRASCAAGRLAPVLARLGQDNADMASLAELAALAGMSRYQLIRKFRACTGMTPHAYQMNGRINLARQALRDGDALAATAHRLGFADQSHFQRVFKQYAGVTPGRYKA